jgi:hypothetical protein
LGAGETLFSNSFSRIFTLHIVPLQLARQRTPCAAVQAAAQKCEKGSRQVAVFDAKNTRK